jgi:adenosylhomocysteine nucleosidase
MAIAFLTPMPIEMRPLAGRLSLDRGLNGLRKGRIDDTVVLAATTGIGTRVSARSTERLLLENVEIAHVVVVGVAGGVDPGLAVGALVVPAVVVSAATGKEYRPATLGDYRPWGKLLTTDQLQTGPDVLAQHMKDEVTAVDMETAAIAEVCERRHVAWSAFRAISDTLTDGVVDSSTMGMVRPDGSTDAGAALRYILRRPWTIPRLARLNRDTKLATTVAADAAVAAVRHGRH